MIVKNDYTNCLTNVACSLNAYFGMPYAHSTMPEVDAMLKEMQPENVIVFLLDGMGANILKRNLPDPAAFLRAHTVKTMTSVFPATTTACTLSMLTALNPIEHGWLGWDMYMKPLDTTATLFLQKDKTTGKPIQDFWKEGNTLINTYMPLAIEKAGTYNGKVIASFIDEKYYEFDNILTDIQAELQKPAKNGRRYIYAYDPIPDSWMHDFGPDSPEVRTCLEERNHKLEEFCNGLKNTLVIILADHGHILQKNIFLKDYPEIEQKLAHTPGIEQRAVSLTVKPEARDGFAETFNRYLGNDFVLHTKEEIIESGLFGDIGNENSPGENPLFRDGLEDYIAIAETTNTALVSGDASFTSGHAGYTDDEIYIPLIMKACR